MTNYATGAKMLKVFICPWRPLMLTFCFLIVFSQLLKGDSLISGVCDGDTNCFLPDCFCPNNTKGPANVSIDQRPQIVVLAFNDAINDRNYNYYLELLTSNWKNANGCPISMTLFVPDVWTNYTQLQQLWLAGAEIAAFGKSGYGQTAEFYKTITKKSLIDEISGQKEQLVKKGKIPAEYIRGFRIPYLYAGGDDMFDVLTSSGFDYDSSLIVNRRTLNSPPSWPATLDYSWPFECKQGKCPSSSHSSFWEIPIHLFYDFNQTYECQYLDSCAYAVSNEEEAFQLLWRNYLPFYRNRTPFVLNLRAALLNNEFQRTAIRRLILTFMESPEVYMLSMSQLVDWMKNVTSLTDITHSEPWSCTAKKLLDTSSSSGSSSELTIIATNIFMFLVLSYHIK
ncbi:chitin deacetylase 8-like [Biomphalaria glabrata]|uniref:Chitin deacetylase 8-like n=1 Tax=Biomphalaria glabrata TaxID=6526 RepID=A0A9W2ZZJ6_BIOGL|nr:chitin deacetylase 8-like [Biomphalaria glabrata]